MLPWNFGVGVGYGLDAGAASLREVPGTFTSSTRRVFSASHVFTLAPGCIRRGGTVAHKQRLGLEGKCWDQFSFEGLAWCCEVSRGMD